MNLSMWLRLAVVGLALSMPAQVRAGLLYVCTETNPGTVETIAPGGATSVFASGFTYPFGLAFRNHENHAPAAWNRTSRALGSRPMDWPSTRPGTSSRPTQDSGTITEFTPSGVGSTFATGLSSPAGIAFGPLASSVPEPSSVIVMCDCLGVISAFLCLRRRHGLVGDDRQLLIRGFRIL